MVVIRLSRGGAKKRPFYHFVVTDKRNRRDGKYIERLGYFNPIAQDNELRINLNKDRMDYWLSKGATPSDRVKSLVKEIQYFGKEGQLEAKAKPAKSKKKKKTPEVKTTPDKATPTETASKKTAAPEKTPAEKPAEATKEKTEKKISASSSAKTTDDTTPATQSESKKTTIEAEASKSSGDTPEEKSD